MIDAKEAAPYLTLPRSRTGGDRSVVRTSTFHSLPCENGGGNFCASMRPLHSPVLRSKLGRGQALSHLPNKLLHQPLPPIS